MTYCKDNVEKNMSEGKKLVKYTFTGPEFAGAYQEAVDNDKDVNWLGAKLASMIGLDTPVPSGVIYSKRRQLELLIQTNPEKAGFKFPPLKNLRVGFGVKGSAFTKGFDPDSLIVKPKSSETAV